MVRPARCLRTAALASIGLLSIGAMCRAAPLAPSGGRWVHPELGYAVDAPTVSPVEWRAVDVEGADIAFRKRDGSTLILMSECERGRAHPSILARQLLIGTRDPQVVESYPIALGTDPGWKQVFRTTEDGRAVVVTAVTVWSAGCTFDWLWVATDRPVDADWFDRWWASFDRGVQEP